MKLMALLVVGMLLISSIPVVGGDTLFKFAEGNGTDASQFGFNVTALGDINGDGYEDVAVGAPYNDSADGTRADCGAVYVFFGYSDLDLFHGNGLDVSLANVTIYGANAGDHFGWAVSDAGDVNGDGYNDTIVGAPDALTGTTRNGSAYIFYGKTTWSPVWDLSTTAADISIVGENDADGFGASVSGAGNYSDSLYDDVIVGAPYADGGGTDRGRAYVFYGDGALPSSAASADFILNGASDNAYFSFTVRSAGNVDGISGPEIMVGEPGNDMAYVYYSPTVDYATEEFTEKGTRTGSYLDTRASDNVYEVLTEGGVSDTLLMDEGFESGLPTGWSHAAWDYTNSPAYTLDNWQVGAPSGTNAPAPHGGNNVAGVVIAGDYVADEGSYLETPMMTIPADASNPEFYFWLYTSTESSYDGLNMKVSVDGGQYSNITTSLAYDGALSTSYSNPIGGESAWWGSHAWTNVSVDMSPYVGHSVRFRWHWGSDTSVVDWGPAIDDLWMHYYGNSALVHKWNFTLSGVGDTEFLVEANHTSNAEGDDFTFYYSVDDVTYTPMLTVTKTVDDNTYQSFTLPAGITGKVYVKVEDTDRTPGNSVKDSLYIDHMFIKQRRNASLIGDIGTDFGRSLSGVGDVNGDGGADMIVGAPGTSNGSAYLYSGMNLEGSSSIKNETALEFNSGSPVKSGVTVMDSNPVEDGHMNQTATTSRYEDFDSMADWEYVSAAIAPSSDTSVYSGFSARIIDTDTAAGQQAREESITYPTTGTVDFYFRVNQTVGDPDGTADGLLIVAIAYTTVGARSYNYLTMAVITDGGYIKYRDDANWVSIVPYSENTWYWMRWDYNMATNTYDVYLNDSSGRLVKYASDAGFAVDGYTINRFWLDTINAPAGTAATLSAYVDELNIASTSGASASYTSAPTTYSDYITGVIPYWNATLANNSNLWVNISRDGGTTWNSTPLQKGIQYVFPAEPRGKTFVYKVELRSSGAFSAVLYDVKFIVKTCRVSSLIVGETSADGFGYSVSGAGDMGGDGVPDILIGAPYNDAKSADGGAIYVFNGSSSPPPTISASDANYVNYSYSAGSHFGFSVSKAGDVNGDGFNDVVVGSPAYSSNDGRASLLSCRKPPVITAYDLVDSSGVSKLNSQLDVGENYSFIVNITHSGGWDKVVSVRIKAWYDFGSETNTYNGTLGGNVNLLMEYVNATGTPQFILRWPTAGEVVLGSCTETYLSTTSRTLNFTFKPMYQFRHAPGDASWDSAPGFNDANSWNFNINVTDSGGWYDSVDDEFGVYRYTYVYAETNPEGTGSPGDTVPMSSSTLHYRTNDAFRLNVSISDLTSGLGTITADNVWVMGGNIAAFSQFGGAGITNAQWIYGSSSNYEAAPLNGVEQSITIDWQVYIPPGTLGGTTYTAPVTYWISQG